MALEGAVRRTLVVASDLQGIPDAVHDGRNGWLVPAEDAAAFAAKIGDVLAMAPCERRAQAECFRAYTAANHSGDRTASAYWQCFVETVKRFRAARARG